LTESPAPGLTRGFAPGWNPSWNPVIENRRVGDLVYLLGI
jgi:hypothetical protein